MKNKLIIDEINNIQNALIIPECFEPDKAKIKEALPDIIKRMMIGSCGLGDILVACEIFKDWLAFTDKPATAEEKSEFPITLNPATVYPFNSQES